MIGTEAGTGDGVTAFGIRLFRRRYLRRSAAAAIIVLLVAWWPARNAGRALVVRADVGTPDAIIMLASHEWERLPATAAEARRYPNAAVLITHPPVVTAHNCYRCDDRVRWLESEGVAEARIRVLSGNITNTHAEAQAARTYLATTPATRLLIVTSPYHTRRALETFETVFRNTRVHIGITPASGTRANPDTWWRSADDRYYVLYEWGASVKSRIAYGVPVLRE